MEIKPQALRDALYTTLRSKVADLDGLLAQFGRIAAARRRRQGDRFSLTEHVRAMVLAQLANQKPWASVARKTPLIADAFAGFDPDLLEREEPARLVHRLRALRAANRASAAQMAALAGNIRTLRTIEAQQGGLDGFASSATPPVIARRLSAPASSVKLAQIGFPLALEYLRNLGVPYVPLDPAVARMLGPERLAWLGRESAPDADAARFEAQTAADGVVSAEIDALVWLFGAAGYGGVCTPIPRCAGCTVRPACRFGASKESAQV